MANESCWQNVARLDWGAAELSVGALLALVDGCVVFGNGLVIAAVASQKALHTTTNFLITSLATSDLLLGVVVLPFSVSQQLWAHVWPFGHLWCQGWLALDVWLCTASIYNLVSISFDRYMAVTRPLRYTLISKARLAPLLGVSAWLVSFFICLPPLLVSFLVAPGNGSTARPSTQSRCDCSPMNNDSVYVIYSALGSFFVPLLLIIGLNIGIYGTIRQSRRNRSLQRLGTVLPTRLLRQRSRSYTSPHDSPVVVRQVLAGAVRTPRCHASTERPQPVGNKGRSVREMSVSTNSGSASARSSVLLRQLTRDSDCSTPRDTTPRMSRLNRMRSRLTLDVQRQKAHSNETRVAKTVGVVIGCFVVCWMPFSVIYAMQAYDLCTVASGCLSKQFFSVAFWLGYCNSMFNPLIYALFSRDFRRAFKRVLQRVTRLCRSTKKTATSLDVSTPLNISLSNVRSHGIVNATM